MGNLSLARALYQCRNTLVGSKISANSVGVLPEPFGKVAVAEIPDAGARCLLGNAKAKGESPYLFLTIFAETGKRDIIPATIAIVLVPDMPARNDNCDMRQKIDAV